MRRFFRFDISLRGVPGLAAGAVVAGISSVVSYRAAVEVPEYWAHDG